MHRADLLTIESTSASKPSLLSSFWSINVQVQNNEHLELDNKGCSQLSLPEVTNNEIQDPPKLIRSLSVNDINAQYEPPQSRQSTIQLPTQAKENPSCRIANWLTNLNINK
ncbi:unnamed protein product [Caenorhabditis bovis]|uniref:Uncharacterized protein n=1 Tax=Caenorhabditis bovis TaxID=2654633 RepID=A0A8S1EMK7_9PELO|nr:unnamed protein product [Caenorhabditis bovis]